MPVVIVKSQSFCKQMEMQHEVIDQWLSEGSLAWQPIL